jgi:hypothetical protein
MSSASKKGAANKVDKDKSAASATYNISDVVLGKIKGFPPWPAMVCVLF